MKLSYREIPGLVSPHALAEHLVLAGQEDVRADEGSTYDLAGSALHHVYFAGLAPVGAPLDTGALRAKIEQRWVSADHWWQQEMLPVALRARGWAVLGQKNGLLRTFELEAHDRGAVMGWDPLIAVDCYEHAYWMDFGTRKDAYLDALYRHINWKAIEARYLVG